MNTSDQKNVDNKLKKFNDIGNGDSHEKTKTPTYIIYKSKRICLGNLNNIQCTKISKRESKISVATSLRYS